MTPLASAFSAMAATASRSMSTARTRAAPARAAAIATRPEPDARSSTRRPATVSGWSSTYRASACPPAQAKAQNGGGCSLRNSPSVSSHRPIGSSAWCSRISGTAATGVSSV